MSGDRLVSDGHRRARRANASTVRRQVEAEYAARLADASWFGRRLLRKQIEREIRKRLDKLASPDALY